MENDYKFVGHLLYQRVVKAVLNLERGVEPDLVVAELQEAIRRYETWVEQIDKENKTDG